jgi:hypothetical protein
MESIEIKDLAKIFKALSSAYSRRENAEVGGTWWEARVMGHIRSLDTFYPTMSYIELYQQFLWRLVPVACLLALALVVLIVRMDFISDYELAKIFTSDPKDFIALAMNN